MQVFFVEQSLKHSSLKALFKKVDIQNDKIKLKCTVQKLKLKKKRRIANKISGILKKNNSNTIILDKNLKQDKDFMNLLYSNNIHIIQGKYLFKLLIEKILKRIILKNHLESNKLKLAITVNDKNEWTLNLIKKMAQQFKYISIVTNNINSFKKLEKELFEEKGIIITISNNKRKSLLKADIILNIDFPEELMNRYRVYDKSIIINLEDNIKIHKKRFNGKIVSDFAIKLKDGSKIAKSLQKEEYKNFDLKDIAECYVMNEPDESQNIIICK